MLVSTQSPLAAALISTTLFVAVRIHSFANNGHCYIPSKHMHCNMFEKTEGNFNQPLV